MAAKKGLYYNINKRKKAGTSRSKKKSTISPEAYREMQKGFPNSKKNKAKRKRKKQWLKEKLVPTKGARKSLQLKPIKNYIVLINVIKKHITKETKRKNKNNLLHR